MKEITKRLNTHAHRWAIVYYTSLAQRSIKFNSIPSHPYQYRIDKQHSFDNFGDGDRNRKRNILNEYIIHMGY